MTKAAVVYTRVSTVDQCCRRQVDELTAFATRCGYEVTGIFMDHVSGASERRPARNRIMDLAQAKRINAVLVTELS